MLSAESSKPQACLQRGAAAEVDESARHGGRAAPASGAFEDEHVGAARAASTAAPTPAMPYPTITTSASRSQLSICVG